MKKPIAILAIVMTLSGVSSESFAEAAKKLSTTSATSATSTTSTAATTGTSSDVAKVETWTQKQWNAAKAEWAKDKTKWSDCQKQAATKKLSGRRSWSFLYSCMTS